MRTDTCGLPIREFIGTLARRCRVPGEIEPIEHKPVVRCRHCEPHAPNTAHDTASASYELEVHMDPRWTQPNGDSSGSGRAHKLQNIVEVLANLTYLTLKDAGQPERVRVYMGLADEQITLLSKHLQINRLDPSIVRAASN